MSQCSPGPGPHLFAPAAYLRYALLAWDPTLRSLACCLQSNVLARKAFVDPRS